jgi:hypothetical protein
LYGARLRRTALLLHWVFVKIPSRKTSCKIETGCSSLAYGTGQRLSYWLCDPAVHAAAPPALSLLMEICGADNA